MVGVRVAMKAVKLKFLLSNLTSTEGVWVEYWEVSWLFRATSRSRAFDNIRSSIGGDLGVVVPLSILVQYSFIVFLHEFWNINLIHGKMSLFGPTYLLVGLSHSVRIRLENLWQGQQFKLWNQDFIISRFWLKKYSAKYIQRSRFCCFFLCGVVHMLHEFV